MRKQRTMAMALATAMAAMTSCSAPRAVSSSARIERTDTFRAILAEQMHVCLDDVVIIPPDTVRPVLTARRMELHRRAVTTIGSVTSEHTESASAESPPPERMEHHLWILIITAFAAYILGARRR